MGPLAAVLQPAGASQPYPPNRRLIHPTDVLSTQPTSYPPNRRLIHPTDAGYAVDDGSLSIHVLSTQPTPCLAN